jgi:hypothetical protein
VTVTQLRRPAAPASPTQWVVATLDRATGFTRVQGIGGGLRLRVGDGRASVGGLVPGTGSLVTASLLDDGSVVVETRTAPPALLVSANGAQLLPAVPGQCKPTRVGPGDRLLLCSASALDAPPVGLVNILRAPVHEVLRMSPTRLLEQILEGTDDGAAAVVLRAGPHSQPASEEDR